MDNTQAFRCNDCQLLFLWPLMSKEDVEAYYDRYDEHIVRRGVAKKKETPLEAFEYREKLLRYRFKRLLPLFRDSERILEIGGGYGNFIGKFVEKGLATEAVFVEACPERLDFACGRFGLEGYKSIEEIKGRKFDLIFMFHVLEHISDPETFINKCVAMLAENGRIIVEVPCSNDPLLTVYDCAAYKDFYFQPMHPAVYSEHPLRLLFEKCGLSLEEFMYEQRYGLSNHLQWLTNGIPGGNPVLVEILGEECETTYKKRLIEKKTTDTIFGIFSKKAHR